MRKKALPTSPIGKTSLWICNGFVKESEILLGVFCVVRQEEYDESVDRACMPTMYVAVGHIWKSYGTEDESGVFR